GDRSGRDLPVDGHETAHRAEAQGADAREHDDHERRGEEDLGAEPHAQPLVATERIGPPERSPAKPAVLHPETPAPKPPYQLVERALAAAIAREPDAPQDFDAWKVRILAQPLRDLRRVLRHGRRAPGTAKSGRRHLTRTLHDRTPEQI